MTSLSCDFNYKSAKADISSHAASINHHDFLVVQTKTGCVQLCFFFFFEPTFTTDMLTLFAPSLHNSFPDHGTLSFQQSYFSTHPHNNNHSTNGDKTSFLHPPIARHQPGPPAHCRKTPPPHLSFVESSPIAKCIFSWLPTPPPQH